MIESEEKRKHLTNLLNTWAQNVKIEPYLRQGDIPTLVSGIIGEFYHITLCCGHQVESFNEGVHIEFFEFNDHSKGTVCGLYCKDCAKKYKKELGLGR